MEAGDQFCRHTSQIWLSYMAGCILWKVGNEKCVEFAVELIIYDYYYYYYYFNIATTPYHSVFVSFFIIASIYFFLRVLLSVRRHASQMLIERET